MENEQKIADILRRRKYFDKYFSPIEGFNYRKDISFVLSNSCPSCGYMTLYMRCGWDICSFCFWEDDGQDNHDADQIFGGPNSDYSLTAHRIEFYDWMSDLKSKQQSNTIKKTIGSELVKLDSYIVNEEENRSIVIEQIELLCKHFNQFREISDEGKPNWRFVNEKKAMGMKPAYNSTLAKAGRSWWQKLFSSE